MLDITTLFMLTNIATCCSLLLCCVKQNLTWRKDALRAIHLHKEGMVMTGPVPLRAGPIGLVTRYAVFIDGAGALEKESLGAMGGLLGCM